MSETTPSTPNIPLLDEWYYQQQSGEFIGPFPVAKLEILLESGVIQPGTPVGRKNVRSVPLYSVVSPGPIMHPSTDDFLANRNLFASTILSGPNNSGKSLALKRLKVKLGVDAFMLSCSRFAQFDVLSSNQGNRELEKRQWHDNFLSISGGVINSENNMFDLGSIIPRLKNTDREKLFELCGETIGGTFSLKSIDPDNEISPKYVDLDGSRLRAVSTGTRLIMTIFATCLDPYFNILLIDEPEMGISPKAQATVAKYLFDPTLRAKWFPSLRQIFVATHSHLFLDRANITNNHAVLKSETGIHIRQIASIAEFHQLQFNMLGNDLESMFLPSAIVVVEGPSDYCVLDRAFKLRYPSKRITVIEASAENEMPNKMKIMGDIFEGIKTSPYRQRIFFALDSVITRGRKGTREKLLSQGADPANIIQWSKNGIEYYYPKDAMREVFLCGDEALDQMKIEGDCVTINGTTYTKVQLGEKVKDKLRANSKFQEEVEDFLNRVGTAGDSPAAAITEDPRR